MVTIIGYKTVLNKDNETFISLELQGDIMMVQSQLTGRFYATNKRCHITSSFDEETAKSLVGRTIPGRIEKVSCEPFELKDELTGEVTMLSSRYEYFPDENGTAMNMRVVHEAA